MSANRCMSWGRTASRNWPIRASLSLPASVFPKVRLFCALFAPLLRPNDFGGLGSSHLWPNRPRWAFHCLIKFGFRGLAPTEKCLFSRLRPFCAFFAPFCALNASGRLPARARGQKWGNGTETAQQELTKTAANDGEWTFIDCARNEFQVLRPAQPLLGGHLAASVRPNLVEPVPVLTASGRMRLDLRPMYAHRQTLAHA